MELNKIKFNFWKFSLFCAIFCYNFAIGYCNDDDYEYSSAVAGLEILMKTEEKLLVELENYVFDISQQIESLKSEIESIRHEHTLAAQNLENYLSNPINSYRLIKRLQNDWKTFEERVQDDASVKNFLNAIGKQRQTMKFPKQSDVYHAALALVRLQDTYKLDVAQLASGILNGVKISTAMSWQDCFQLGYQLYEMRDFNHTVSWLKHSMEILTSQEYNEDPMSLDFMESVATYYQALGDFKSAIDLVKYILQIDSTRVTMLEMKGYLENMISDGIKAGLIHETVESHDYHQTNEFKLYEKVCRGEISISPKQQRPLRCRYHRNNVAFRLLQPFKMEELFHDPYIVQFHDVIRSEQMNVLKQLASPKMARSRVVSLNGTDEVVATYRTSKSAWFDYRTHRYMREMRQNIVDFSGLDMSTAEELQVANYGIGGHYEPHWDFFTDLNAFEDFEGNRIATAIFYLSDVEEGGGTAFPFLPLLVNPRKGSVAFWYNLHSSEEPDYRTKHGACPVLRGSKWIANAWVRARGQELKHPCNLQDEHEISLIYKDYD